MENLYIVSYVRHNKQTGGFAYKEELATPSLDEAKKKYHALLGEYISNALFDFVSVKIFDAYGTPIQSEYWLEEGAEVEQLYLVAYLRHNVESGGNAYKVDLATSSIDEAKKKYHALLGEYIDNPTFDFVSTILFDSFGNTLQTEYWEVESEEV